MIDDEKWWEVEEKEKENKTMKMIKNILPKQLWNGDNTS